MLVVDTDVEKVVPVPSEEPPVAEAYQLITPRLDVAPNETLPAPQLEPAVVPVIDGAVLTNTVMALDIAGEPKAQLALVVITQLTRSPFVKVDELYVLWLAPLILLPLTNHWYAGDKPL